MRSSGAVSQNNNNNWIVQLQISWIIQEKWKLFENKMSSNQVRQNFHEDCEEAINRQINMELFASYTYLSMVNIDVTQ